MNKGKHISRLGVVLGIIVLLLLFGSSFTFTINQDEVGVKKRFGKITEAYINSPQDLEAIQADLESRGYNNINVTAEKGLHFKLPFVDSVEKYTSKYITYTSTTETINTRDKRKIDIQTYAQYKIYNPVFVSMTFGTAKSNVSSLVDDRISPVVVQIGNSLKFTEFFQPEVTSPLLDEKRSELNDELTLQYGINVVDIGIHRKNFPTSNIASIEKKMSEEILKESEALVAIGESEYNKSVAETDRIKAEKVAQAREDAAIIMADSDKEAMQIYQESLKKDLSFYRFIKRMETYRTIQGNTIFLDRDNDFLSLINGY